jgi:hypothetical protein
MNPASLSGTLHIYVAFDWGDEIDLDKARRLAPTASAQDLARRRRTPTSFSYRPPPLHFALGSPRLELAPLGILEVSAGLVLFDFGAVSLSVRVPLCCSPDSLLELAGTLAEPSALVHWARTLLEPLFEQLKPAIQDAMWPADLSEEYFVFQFGPDAFALAGDEDWLAGMVHLERGRLSKSEVIEALRLKLTYSPEDLLLADWAAALLFDRDCEETLQAIEFANIQLLEFRNIDNRLDQNLAAASREVRPTRHWLRFWRLHTDALRRLGELKVEANGLFERTGNALKLVGDPYLARVYRLLAQRFHLEAWEENIQRKLEVAEGVYKVASDQASEFRAEFLEATIVVLILFEIIMTFVRH